MAVEGEGIEKSRQLAEKLAAWDTRIVQVAAIGELAEDTNIDLVCSFEPEPDGDATGYFWIVNLLARIEFEGLDEQLAVPFAYELGFKLGEQVFLPNGEILKEPEELKILWTANAE